MSPPLRRFLCGLPTAAPFVYAVRTTLLSKTNDGSADLLRAELDAIVTENRVIDDLEEDVRKICGVHGVVLAVGGSLRTTDKKRRSMLMLKCRHGVKNRQASWQALQYDGET